MASISSLTVSMQGSSGKEVVSCMFVKLVVKYIKQSPLQIHKKKTHEGFVPYAFKCDQCECRIVLFI